MNPLDNPVWHALNGPQSTLAERAGCATRYPSEFAPFGALPDVIDNSCWTDLGDLVGPGNIAVLFREELEPPKGWQVLQRWPTVQLVLAEGAAQRLIHAADEHTGPITLGPADVDEMLDLVGRTDPGPLARRTLELGTYLGIRRGGSLVAMAGQRMHLRGYREISAVCTDPSVRGQGLARDLVSRLVTLIVGDGEVPFLHALASNVAAVGLYEAMGFELRRHDEVVALIPPSSPDPAPRR